MIITGVMLSLVFGVYSVFFYVGWKIGDYLADKTLPVID